MPLDPTTSKHSVQNAAALARASQIAYGDEPDVRAKIADAIGKPLRDLKCFKVEPIDTNAFLAGFDDCIVLAFRGSKSLQNWLSDGQVLLVPFRRGGHIHIGFRDSVNSVYAAIDGTLTQWSGSGRTLWITGHSLGGALAMLTAAYLRFPADPTLTLPRPFAGLYTFGQPRVGDAQFCNMCAADFNSFYFRYVNDEDIVTRVPPRELGYWHTGHDEFIDSKGASHEDPAWWQIFLDRIKVGLATMQDMRNGKFTINPDPARNPIAVPIIDHLMENYIAKIDKLRPH